MDIIIDNSSGEPIYQQIVNQIKNLIVTGQVKEREMLPSIRQLAKDLRVSVITTKRAYEELERGGFISSIPGKGSFVAPFNRELVKESQREMIEKKIEQVIEASKMLNLSLEEVIEMVRFVYDKQK